jgi:hypothetical protein
MSLTNKFWIVTRNPAEVNYNNPTNAYYSKEDAKKNAEALCKKTGHQFFILEAIESCQTSTPPVEWKPVYEPNRLVQGKVAERKRDAYGRFTSVFDDLYDLGY